VKKIKNTLKKLKKKFTKHQKIQYTSKHFNILVNKFSTKHIIVKNKRFYNSLAHVVIII